MALRTASPVTAALGRLTPLQQQVISLRFMEQVSLQETARRLNRPPSAIRAVQYRALRRLGMTLRTERPPSS